MIKFSIYSKFQNVSDLNEIMEETTTQNSTDISMNYTLRVQIDKAVDDFGDVGARQRLGKLAVLFHHLRQTAVFHVLHCNVELVRFRVHHVVDVAHNVRVAQALFGAQQRSANQRGTRKRAKRARTHSSSTHNKQQAPPASVANEQPQHKPAATNRSATEQAPHSAANAP